MPHLRSLVKRYEDSPFELIGININDGVDDYKAGLEEHKVSWLSAYHPQEDGEPAILGDYAIQYFPTYIVLDVDGTVAWRSGDKKNTHGSMDDAIEALVKKAKEKAGK